MGGDDRGVRDKTRILLAQKGQALIWAANLLHGGSRQNDFSLTRWSQVSHYYFQNCSYYTPAFSDPLIGNLCLREIHDVADNRHIANVYIDAPVEDVLRPGSVMASDLQPVDDRDIGRGFLPPLSPRSSEAMPGHQAAIPSDFDAQVYFNLHPDVSGSGMTAERHYQLHGKGENRRYK